MLMSELLSSNFNLEQAVMQTREKGYVFAATVINPYFCSLMETEIERLNLEEGDHVNYPINAGSSREVKQLHERAYFPIWHEQVPVATEVTELLAEEVRKMNYPELQGWHPTEAGYQRYRNTHDWISPHRDRRNDQLLSATITISGSAPVRIYEPVVDPDDYKNLRQTDEFITSPGTLMLLRAPGLGNGEQIIHEVLPPQIGSRLILNLRMRSTILKTPKEFKELIRS